MMRRCLLLTLSLSALCAGAVGAATVSLRCVRSLPTAAKPGDVVGVALALSAPAEAAGALVVTEDPPDHWQISSVTAGGAWDGERITWNLTPTAGEPVLLAYSAQLPDGASGVGVFHGHASHGGAEFAIDGSETVPIGASINVGGFDLNTWELIGLLGTLVFASRFILQWIASERAGKSVVPVAFWWISLLGTTILTLYGIHFRRMAVVVGQASGFAVYIRNLMLIHQHKKRVNSDAS